MVGRRLLPALLVHVALCALASTAAAQVPPPSTLSPPTLLAPANGASVTVPFTISWSPVTGIPDSVGGYTWELSASSTFTPLLFWGGHGSEMTQEIISGLPNGTYFWRVRAYSALGFPAATAVSETRSFTVTGVGPGTPGTPVLAPPLAYSTLHPCEDGRIWWTAVPDAQTYFYEVSRDPGFPHENGMPGIIVGTPGMAVPFHFPSDPVQPTTGIGGTAGLDFLYPCTEGTQFMRVWAVSADGIRSLPSNVISWSYSLTSPIPPAPRALSPLNGETLTLPITLTWEHVPNPQSNGYQVQVATDPTFLTLEDSETKFTGFIFPEATLRRLTPGTKFWRVRSLHGIAVFPDPLIPGSGASAATAWSATGTFTVSSAPTTIVSVDGWPNGPYGFFSERLGMSFQLSAVAPVGGLVVNCTSSNPSVLPVPASVTIPQLTSQGTCGGVAGPVTTPTVVTVTATVGSSSGSFDVTVLPPTLRDFGVPDSLSGGSVGSGGLTLWGSAPPGGTVVSLSSDSPAVIVPSTVTVPGGTSWVSVPITTSEVTVPTMATITATYNVVSDQSKLILNPVVVLPPVSVTLSSKFHIPSLGGGVNGKVTIASISPYGQMLQLTSSNPSVVTFSTFGVGVAAGSQTGIFNINAFPVSVETVVTISVSAAGVTRSAQFTVYPARPTASLVDGVTVNQTRVMGGTSWTGTVTVNGGAPAGGLVVMLSSDSAAVTVPASVIVPAGAGVAAFPVTTSAVSAETTATISATLGTTESTTLTVTPGPPLLLGSLDVFSGFPGVVGGNPITGTVTLVTPGPMGTVVSAVAPAGGVVVPLFSTDPTLVSAPASVTIPEGAHSATFTVTTSPVTFFHHSFIWGTFAGQTYVSAVRVIEPPLPPPPPPQWTLSSLALDPVVGGTPASGTVTVSAPAPPGGLEVVVSTHNQQFVPDVQDKVVVPAGATSATFLMPTFPIAGTGMATVTAWLPGAGPSRLAILRIDSSEPTLASLSLNPTTVIGGVGATGTVTLSAAAPTGGVIVTLANNSSSVNVPAGITVPAGATSANFTIGTSSVSTTTAVTITATLGGSTRTAILTYNPTPPAPTAPTLLGPADQATVAQPVTFTWNGAANATTYRIEIANTSTFTTTLASQTTSGSQATLSGLPAQRLWWRVRGVNAAGIAGPFSASRRFTAQAAAPAPPPPAAASLSAVSVTPASVVGGNGATGAVTLTSAAPTGGLLVTLSSSNASVASLPASVTVAAGASSATFAVTTSSVASATPVTITGTQGTTTRTASLTVNAVPPLASLSTITLTPPTVTGGGPATGTVTLTSAAPAGGLAVTLSSSNTTIASLASSVTIAAGATSASFTVTTASVTSATAITITGSGGGAIRTATLTVSPPPIGAVLTLAATGRAGESISSTPAGLTANVGTTGSANFPAGTSVTLTVSNGRVAIWSGGCSSNGAKTKSCSFTINAATSVTANVQ